MMTSRRQDRMELSSFYSADDCAEWASRRDCFLVRPLHLKPSTPDVIDGHIPFSRVSLRTLFSICLSPCILC